MCGHYSAVRRISMAAQKDCYSFFRDLSTLEMFYVQIKGKKILCKRFAVKEMVIMIPAENRECTSVFKGRTSVASFYFIFLIEVCLRAELSVLKPCGIHFIS